MINFNEKPKTPISAIVHDFLKPFLIQTMDQKVNIVIRELNYIPNDICLDLSDYKKILYQLIKNSLSNCKHTNLMIVDISYYQIKDVEGGHRRSMTKTNENSV
jgi:hypothetical protein